MTSLVTKFDVTKYLTPTSDLIALMTLEHQAQAMYYMNSVSAAIYRRKRQGISDNAKNEPTAHAIHGRR